MTDFPERFNGLSHITIKAKDGSCSPYQITRVRFASRFVFVTLKGVTALEQAELLRGGEIQVAAQERVSLPEGTYFRDDIVGLHVYLLEGDVLLGKVETILETGGNDVYVVRQDDREYLIPALKSVVKSVDILKNKMIICPMEGLLDL